MRHNSEQQENLEKIGLEISRMKEGSKYHLVVPLQLVDLPNKLIGELSIIKMHRYSYVFIRFDSSIAFCDAIHSARRRYNSCSRGDNSVDSSASSGCVG